LKDPVFVDAAMKGVEKGFRLHAEGKACKPFNITSIPDVTLPRRDCRNTPVLNPASAPCANPSGSRARHCALAGR
jgi:hypothetical protein